MSRIFVSLAILVGLMPLSSSGLTILKSTAVMDLSWDSTTNGELPLPEIYMLEEDTSEYILKVLKENEYSLGIDQTPLLCSTAVRDQNLAAEDGNVDGQLRRSIDAVVTCTHASPDSTDEKSATNSATVKLVDLDTALMQNVNPMDLPLLGPKLSFRPYRDTIVIEQFEENSSKTVADITLIVTTVVLSIMLLILASILLYVNGGWSICWQRCNNCLFEEIIEDDDDEYMMDKNGTFQVDSMYATEEEEGDDGISVETGLQTAPSGILGAEQGQQRYSMDDIDINDEENPAAGMGIQTPHGRQYDDDNDTRMSDSTMMLNQHPLGIQGMPSHMKSSQSQPETPDTNADDAANNNTTSSSSAQKGGLAHMIYERLYGGSGSGTE